MSASKAEKQTRSNQRNSFRLERLDYDPFLTCKKHSICLARAKLTSAQRANGYYYPFDPDNQAKSKDGLFEQVKYMKILKVSDYTFIN